MSDIQATVGSEGSLPATTQRRRRWWFPRLIVIALVVAVAYIRWGPGMAEDHENQVALQWLCYSLAVLLGLIWFFLLAGFRWRSRLLGVAGLVLAVVLFRTAVRNVDLTGDLAPHLEFRWSPEPDALLLEHRGAQSKLGPLDPTEPVVASSEEISPGFRGSNRDGRVGEQPISADWTTHAPVCRWRQPVGGGYSGFAVYGSLLITLEQRGADEAIVAYDAPTGKERWVHAYPAFFTSVLSGEGPRATPCIADGRVYSVGATGILVCLDMATGNPLWNVDLYAENGMESGDAGITASPLIVGPHVVVYVGAQGGSEKSRALLAFDKSTGARAWGGGRAKAGYSSPMLAPIGGAEQILIYDRMGLAGYDPQSGDELWRFEIEDDTNIVAVQPVMLSGDRIYFGTDIDCLVVHIASVDGKWTAKQLWRANTLRCEFCSPIAVGDSIYGLDKGILTCIDAATGKRRWKKGRFGHGQMLLVNDYLLVFSELGEVGLVEVNPAEFKELGRFEAIDGKMWNMPSLVGGIVYLRNHHEMASYDLAPGRNTAVAIQP